MGVCAGFVGKLLKLSGDIEADVTVECEDDGTFSGDVVLSGSDGEKTITATSGG